MRQSRALVRPSVAALLAACIACAGCGPRDPAPSNAGTARVVLPEGPLSLTLIGGSDRASDIVGGLVSDGLVGVDRSLNRIPLVAESWWIDVPNARVVFRLRDGVRWHDGEPVTAEDVVATWRAIVDPDSEAISWIAGMSAVTSVVAEDARTAVVTYDPFPADPLEVWRAPLLPAHRVGDVDNLATSAFGEAPVGCGAFRFVEYLPERSLTLAANEDYWAGRPGIDGLVFEFLSDERTAYEAMLLGDVDMITLSPALWTEVDEDPRSTRVEKEAYYRLMSWYVGWNQDGSNPFFGDPRVRRALLVGLDRERFNRATMMGMAIPAATAYHPEWTWAHPGLAARAHDDARAAELLAAAGWVDRDGDGVREKDGREFRFRLLTNATEREIVRRLLQWMQDEWRELGVAVELEMIEWDAFQTARRAGQFEAALGVVSYGASDTLFEMFHTSGRTNGINYGGFSDPECDALLESIRDEGDPDARRERFLRLQERLYELEPVANLFHMPSPVLRARTLEGVQYSPLDGFRFHPGPRAWRRVEES